MSSAMRTLFLNPPSYEGFDGGAGSRYQAKREIRSFWYPTWLAQPAALITNSKVIDAPADDLDVDEVLRLLDALQFTEKHGEVCPANWRPGQDAMKPTPDGVSGYLARLG